MKKLIKIGSVKTANKSMSFNLQKFHFHLAVQNLIVKKGNEVTIKKKIISKK